jgi:hypothetical protein
MTQTLFSDIKKAAVKLNHGANDDFLVSFLKGLTQKIAAITGVQSRTECRPWNVRARG